VPIANPQSEHRNRYHHELALAASGRTLVTIAVLILSAGCATFSTDPGIREQGVILDDNIIESMVKRQIRKSDPGFANAHLTTVSYNGVVLLLGQVSSEALKIKASSSAEKIGKVRKVHNELEVGAPISYVARSNDNLLTAKLKSKLLVNAETSARKVKVATENGVVYLMGMLPRTQADRVVEVARSVFGVQKIIKVFEYTDT
jgi:osmotically-inducible protein OsmY